VAWPLKVCLFKTWFSFGLVSGMAAAKAREVRADTAARIEATLKYMVKMKQQTS